MNFELTIKLGLVAFSNGGKMPYSNEGIAIMNIQFDLAWEEVYGVLP